MYLHVDTCAFDSSLQCCIRSKNALPCFFEDFEWPEFPDWEGWPEFENYPHYEKSGENRNPMSQIVIGGDPMYEKYK